MHLHHRGLRSQQKLAGFNLMQLNYWPLCNQIFAACYKVVCSNLAVAKIFMFNLGIGGFRYGPLGQETLLHNNSKGLGSESKR